MLGTLEAADRQSLSGCGRNLSRRSPRSTLQPRNTCIVPVLNAVLPCTLLVHVLCGYCAREVGCLMPHAVGVTVSVLGRVLAKVAAGAPGHQLVFPRLPCIRASGRVRMTPAPLRALSWVVSACTVMLAWPRRGSVSATER